MVESSLCHVKIGPIRFLLHHQWSPSRQHETLDVHLIGLTRLEISVTGATEVLIRRLVCVPVKVQKSDHPHSWDPCVNYCHPPNSTLCNTSSTLNKTWAASNNNTINSLDYCKCKTPQSRLSVCPSFPFTVSFFCIISLFFQFILLYLVFFFPFCFSSFSPISWLNFFFCVSFFLLFRTDKL